MIFPNLRFLKQFIFDAFTVLKKQLLLSPILVLFFISFLANAQYNVPKKPNFIPPVIDSTKTLGNREYQFLYDKLKNYSDTTSTEIIIVIIPTTKGENIGLLAPRWGHAWGVGQAKEDNGVFILLAKDDRKIWIAPGYGVEQKLTAGINGEIIRNIIIPEFKKGDYYVGLDKGTDAIFEVLKGEYKGAKKKFDKNDGIPIGVIFLVIFIIIFISLSKNRRGGSGGNRGNRSGEFDIWDAIILSNMGRGNFGGGSGGFGGSSGGGFGGFGGGGGFSGGGAGGSW